MRLRLTLLALALACTAETEATSSADTAAPIDTPSPADTATGGDDATPDDTAAPEDTGSPDDTAAPEDVFTPTLANNFGVEETEGRAVCDNLAGLDDCMLPFPSDFFRREEGGRTVLDYRGGVLPDSNEGLIMTAEPLMEYDGYGASSPILVHLPGATLTGTAPIFDAAASLESDTRTIILDATTGERVPHWVEPDYLARLPEGETLVVLRSAQAFEPGRTYIVGVRGLVDAQGQTLPAPKGFAALASQSASTVRGVHARRATYENQIFPVLAQAGWERSELQLAWAFTTSSKANSGDLLYQVRDAILGALPPEGPTYTIDSVEENPDVNIAYKINGTAQIPSVMGPPDDTLLRRMRRDADGKPVVEGFESVEFSFQIPVSVMADPGKAAVLQYGHGFLGERGEANNSWLREFANRKGFAILACDMQGMSTEEAAIWGANVLVDAGRFPTFTEKVMQGIANHLALVRMLKGRFLAETDPRVSPGGKAVYDPSRIYYYGNSQGGTLGASIVATSKDITRGVLGVPGGAFPFLLHRSVDFTTWTSLLIAAYGDPLELSKILGLLGTGFNRIDGLVHLAWIREGYDGFGHEVLLHVAKEDAQVNNQVSFMLARRLGVPLLTPAVRPVFGVAEAPLPHTGSALVEFDFLMPENPHPELPPPAESDTHSMLRRSPLGQDQLWGFLETGVVNAVCDGPCDPE